MSILDHPEQQSLIDLAHRGLRHAASGDGMLRVDLETFSKALREPRSCFVTLHLAGSLRGCVGSLEPRASLAEEVARAVYGAACRDPRFSPITPAEVARVDLHISVLSSPRDLAFTSEAELLAQLEPHVHGVTIRDRGRVGTFLPVVWERFDDRQTFVANLKEKAGLGPHHFSPTMSVQVYTTQCFGAA